jgi:hypothetical protein
MTPFGHQACPETFPLLGDQRTPQFEDVTSAFDPDY